jgi:hypothetical protein
MYSIISINIGPILAFGTGPQILPAGALAKRSRSPVCSGAGGGGMLQAKRSRSTVCSRTGGGGILRAKQSRSTACSEAGGGDVLWVKRSRSRVNRSSGVEGTLRRRRRAPGEAINIEGEPIERHRGALHRRQHALGIGAVKDLKRASGKNLLSVEQAARPDIYIGAICMTRVH